MFFTLSLALPRQRAGLDTHLTQGVFQFFTMSSNVIVKILLIFKSLLSPPLMGGD